MRGGSDRWGDRWGRVMSRNSPRHSATRCSATSSQITPFLEQEVGRRRQGGGRSGGIAVRNRRLPTDTLSTNSFISLHADSLRWHTWQKLRRRKKGVGRGELDAVGRFLCDQQAGMLKQTCNEVRNNVLRNLKRILNLLGGSLLEGCRRVLEQT